MSLLVWLLYGLVLGGIFSLFVIFTLKYKINRNAQSLTGSHEKIITVYEEWKDTKIKIQMTEWTWELLTKDEWINFAYKTWVGDLLCEACEDPLVEMETHWFGEAVGSNFDPKKIDTLLKS